MWQHLIWGFDPNQILDSSIFHAASAPNAAEVTFPSFGAPQEVPPNQAFIIHAMNAFQGNGAVTARRIQMQVFGPIITDGVMLEEALIAAPDSLILRRPLLLGPGFFLTIFRNGFDAGSTIQYTVWWQRVSLPAKRSLDKSRSPSPRRLDEIFMIGEG